MAIYTSWQDHVKDPTERKVFEALENPSWDFRTIEGLSKDTGLPKDVVKGVLEKYPQFIRRSPVPDPEGRDLYTLISKGGGLREWYSTTRAFVIKSTST